MIVISMNFKGGQGQQGRSKYLVVPVWMTVSEEKSKRPMHGELIRRPSPEQQLEKKLQVEPDLIQELMAGLVSPQSVLSSLLLRE